MHNSKKQLSPYSRFLRLIDIVSYTTMISLVIFGVSGYILSQILVTVPIEMWSLVLLISFVSVFILSLYNSKIDNTEHKFSIRNFVLGLLPFLLLLSIFIPLALSERLQISHHGPFHMGYITQIIKGVSPPENVVLPGFPANVYWLYHALLAVFANTFRLPQPAASAIINFIALIGSFYWIRKSVGILGLKNKNPFITSCYTILILFGANLFGSVYVIWKSIFYGKFYPKALVQYIRNENIVLFGDGRIGNLTSKFFNFNGLPIGIIYLTFSIYISILILNGHLTIRDLLVLIVAIAGALIFHTTTGVFTLLIIPFSLLITFLFVNSDILKVFFKTTSVNEWIIFVFLSAVLLIPIFYFLYEVSTAMPAKTHIGTSVIHSLSSVFSASYPLIPLSILAVYFAYRKIPQIIFFFLIVALSGYTLSCIFELPDHNEYKFVFLATVTVSTLSVIALDYLYYNLKYPLRLVGRLIFYIMFMILGISIAFAGIRYYKDYFRKENPYYYQNGHVYLKPETQNKNVMEWIRDNTQPNTIVILPLPSKNSGSKINLLKGDVYIIAERIPYVAYGHIFAEGIDEYQNRYENIIDFYSDSTPIEKKVEILGEFEEFSRKRQSVLLIPNKDVESLRPYLDKLKLIYRGRDAELYSFN